MVLDIIHVAAAMRRAVLVAGSSKGLSACRPRLAVLKASRAAGALMRTETSHEAREYQRNPPAVPDGTSTVGHRFPFAASSPRPRVDGSNCLLPRRRRKDWLGRRRRRAAPIYFGPGLKPRGFEPQHRGHGHRD